MMVNFLNIFKKQQPVINEFTVEELLGLMAENEEEPPKSLPECINIGFLSEDNQFLYFGKTKSKECPCTKTIILKAQKKDVLKELSNLKEINGWEFKHQILEGFDWKRLMEEFRHKGIASWEIDTNHHFKIEKKYIIYTLVLKFISKKVVVEEMKLEGRFEKATLKMTKHK